MSTTKTINLTIDGVGTGYSDAAYVIDGDVPTAITQAVLGAIGTDITITIGGVTATLAMWLDPDHWEHDWADVLDGATFDEYVLGLAEVTP